MHDEPVAATATPDDAFGADLWRVLTEDASQTVFSPVSVAAALRMALCGARGQTAAELAGALHEAPDAAAGGPSATAAGELSATAAGELSATAAGELSATAAEGLRAT